MVTGKGSLAMNASNEKAPPYLPFKIIIIAFMIFLSLKLRLMPYADDVFFSNALKDTSLIDYLLDRYHTWSGRLFIEAIMTLTITTHVFWRVMIPVCFALSAYFMWSISLRGQMNYKSGTLLAMALMLAMPAGVAGDAQWWVTGFYNYLLPVTCALFLVDTVAQGSTSKTRITASILGSLIATSCEQIALALPLVLTFVFLASNRESRNKKIFLLTMATILIGAAITFLSPGSQNRYYVEASRYMPQILEMNIFQKPIIGIDRIIENISTSRNILFIAALISFICYLVKAEADTTSSKICMAIASICLFSILTSSSYYMSDPRTLTYNGKFPMTRFGDYKVYLSYFFYSLTLVAMAIGALTKLNGRANHAALLTLFTGGLITIAIGLSPTAYASNERVLYMFNISLCLYTLFNIRSIIGTLRPSSYRKTPDQ